MKKDFIEEMQWRGLIHDIIPGTQEQLQREITTGYIGFDPTATSLHIGNLVPIILLKHFQDCGHKPIVLVGGATGMIGDPSGKSQERNLLDEKVLQKNILEIKRQLQKFLRFDNMPNSALIVNNYDWAKRLSFIEFVRDIGKHITVNYMIAKESVKKRIEKQQSSASGISFTEFTYQLIQGYDFLQLYKSERCKFQMGGSDQWGNITTGVELIRRKEQAKAYAMTCPLITKADGTKFGKTEDGNIWLDKYRTSVYKFYQYWLNISDDDAKDFIKKFTFLPKKTIEDLIRQHDKQPHLRVLQKTLSHEITLFVHSKQDYENALKATQVLFGKSTIEDLKELDERTFLEIFKEVPQATISKIDFEKGLNMKSAFVGNKFLSSNAELRRALKENSIYINKQKVGENYIITKNDLIAEKYTLLQRGKKKYFLLKRVEA